MSVVADALVREFRALELTRDRPVRRELTCINVERGPKARFELLRSVYSARLGRALTHWEAFAVLLAEAEERYAFELDTMRGR